MSEWDSDEGILKGAGQILGSIALSLILGNITAHIAWWYCGHNPDLSSSIGQAAGWLFAFISLHLICRNRW